MTFRVTRLYEACSKCLTFLGHNFHNYSGCKIDEVHIGSTFCILITSPLDACVCVRERM